MRGRTAPASRAASCSCWSTARSIRRSSRRWTGAADRASGRVDNAPVQSILEPKWALFVQVADAGSVTAAALALDMQQSVVSRHIARLEAEAGTRLFRRTGRGVVLTEFGEQVYPRVKALLRDAEQLADDMRTSRGVPAGDVRFGLLPSTVPVLAGALFTAVRKAGRRCGCTSPRDRARSWKSGWRRGGSTSRCCCARRTPPAPTKPCCGACLCPSSCRRGMRWPRASRSLSRTGAVAAGAPEPAASAARAARAAGAAGRRHAHAGAGSRLDPPAARDRCVRRWPGHHGRHAHAARGGRLVAVPIVRPVLSRSIVLGVTQHRAHTLATREVAQLLRKMAPAMLKEPGRR
ncbi:LysR family transcriptional regulator [Ramlibacter terrae]|uniref:LysR family transcriptional regulator n=1 Tax=Ramlibacter terrae TaxID=2732511 RepID=A0ABX6P106_9BURK|nr:LysR family transcriptional regulator [Ramlibacter terrae]